MTSLIVVAFLSCIDFWCFSSSFYQNEYHKLNNAEIIGISQHDLNKVTDVVLGYLRNEYSSLDFKCKINGNEREVFNDKEKAHMVDVKNLYQDLLKLRLVFFIFYLLSFVYICFRNKIKYLFTYYKKSLLIFVSIIGFIFLFCLIDFDGFWTTFHHFFFSNNDLWLLDPTSDILIMMVPEQFFYDLCMTIIFSFILFILAFFFIFKYISRKFAND